MLEKMSRSDWIHEIRWYGESYLVLSLVPETQTRRSLLEAFTVVCSRLVGFELHDAVRLCVCVRKRVRIRVRMRARMRTRMRARMRRFRVLQISQK